MKHKPVSLILNPPQIILALIVISIGLHYNFPIKQIIYFPYNLLSITGIVVGVWLAMWGKKTFRKLDTPLRPGEKPKKVVTEGPFKFSRNPIYLGFVIFLLGVAVLFGSLVAFISPVIFFLIIYFVFIPFEEKLMEKTFGKKYLDYKRNVRKWI